MKTPYLGKKGHIAVGTTDVEKAMEYLKSQGIESDMETAKYKNKKNPGNLLENKKGFLYNFYGAGV